VKEMLGSTNSTVMYLELCEPELEVLKEVDSAQTALLRKKVLILDIYPVALFPTFRHLLKNLFRVYAINREVQEQKFNHRSQTRYSSNR
jgi:hypothetical protein